jgi:hypothetical protein
MKTIALLCGLAALGGACSKTTPPAGDKPSGMPASNPGATPQTAPPPPAAPAAPPAPAAAPVEAMEAPVDPKQTVSGKIVLPAARQGDVKRGDTLFVIARKAGNVPGAPLAVQRLQAGDFPLPFSLSSRDAMVQGIPFEGDISITVRVDKDGDAMTRRKGDVFGQVPKVQVGKQDVVISLDTLQAEDVTLGGGMPMGGARPGLPPGHP